MLASLLFRRLALVVAVLGGSSQAALAQSPGTGELLVYRTESLTSATRDALVRELATRPDLKVVYACVPAGLIAFEATSEGAHDQVAGLLRQQNERASVERLDMDMPELEQLCSQQRGQ